MQKKIFEKISHTFKSTSISRTFECTTNSHIAEVQAHGPDNRGLTIFIATQKAPIFWQFSKT